jgi:class 3 adenylate cyclase/tetratricopeptide (TPR) repeat protein
VFADAGKSKPASDGAGLLFGTVAEALMSDEVPNAELNAVGTAYDQARLAFEARDWADTIKYAAQVLCAEPHHAGAFELLSAARRQLERQGAPAGEQRLLSVLMCDLVDSARLPGLIGREPYRNLLRDIQEVCASAVTRYEGRIAQYLGDGILAYFSYPQAHEDDPLRAALAALAIVGGMDLVRGRRVRSDSVDVAVRIGIDLGVVMVGSMGAGQWTTTDSIVGDPPNFAARLQAIAPRNGIVASAATYERIAPFVRARALRARQFKGFDGKRRTYELLSAMSALDRADIAIHQGSLVGRDVERATLSAEWRQVLEGKCRVLALVGEAGMGKTRLADELVNVVHATGGTHLTMRCSALYRHVPFYPITLAVRGLLGVASTTAAITTEEIRRGLSKLVGSDRNDEIAESLAQLVGAPLDDRRLPEQRRERTLCVLVSLVRSLLAQKRLLLLIEDLHDADPSTLEFVGRVVATVQEPFALLVTSRPEIDVAARLPGVKQIAVGPLSDDACTLLAERILGARKLLIESVVARASGSPLFAKELAQWLDRGHALGDMPPALDLLLTARIDAVEPDLRELLVTASVIGTQFEVGDLALLAGCSRAATEHALERLTTDGLLELDVEHPTTTRRFRHSLFRDAAYGRLPPSEKARQHLCIANIYEQNQSEGRLVPPAIIARHLYEGGAPARALHFWHRAALDARATAAHTEAVQHYEAAIGLLTAISDPMEHAAVALPLQLGLAASASMVLGYTAERVLLAFEQANALTQAMPRSPERFTATIGLQTFALVTGQLDRAEGLAESALQDVVGSPDLEGTAYASLAYVRFFQGRLAEARALCMRADKAVPTLGVPQDPAVVNHLLLGLLEWFQGNDAAGQRICIEALRAAEQLDSERAAFTRAFLLTYLAWRSQMANDAHSASEYASEAIALSKDHGFLQWLGAATLHLGAARCELGELPTGVAMLEAALSAWRNAGAGLMLPYFMGRLAAAKMLANDTSAALQLFDGAIARARVTGEQLYLAELYRLRARCRKTRGEPAQFIAEDLDRAIALSETLQQRVFALRALSDQLELGYHVGQAGRELQRRLDDARQRCTDSA